MEFPGNVDKQRIDKVLQDLLWDKELVNSRGDKQEIYRLKVPQTQQLRYTVLIQIVNIHSMSHLSPSFSCFLKQTFLTRNQEILSMVIASLTHGTVKKRGNDCMVVCSLSLSLSNQS